MKRQLLSAVLTWTLAGGTAVASQFYINDGVVSVVYPPTPPPQIDATNFINNGIFEIINNQTTLPYETQNTLNYSNRNQMRGSPGFRLMTYTPGADPARRRAAHFVNANLVNETNATISGDPYLVVNATNVVNRGTLAVGSYGLLSLSGRHLDLGRGSVNVEGTDVTEFAGVFDRYWGVDTNDFFSGRFNQYNPSSAPHMVTNIQNQMYIPFYRILTLTGGFTFHVVITPTGPTNQTVDVLFLSQPNPQITTEVRFSGPNKYVLWQAIVTNCFTGRLITNRLYLADDFGGRGTNIYVVQTYRGTPYNTPTFHPVNYTFTRAFPFFTNYTLIAPTVFDPTIFYGDGYPVGVTNAGYGATLTGSWSMVDTNVSGATFSNLPGRIEIVADTSLNLSRTRISGQSYLRLSSTNHFVGNTNSEIFSPVTDLSLGTTNRTLKVASLLAPTLPNFGGEIDVWSGRWTNATATLQTLYRVTMVDSRLTTQVPTLISHLSLRGPEVVIGDIMNVFSNLLIDAEHVTLTRNPPGAPTAAGELNFTVPHIVWAPSFPRLQCLTNWGRISSLTATYFAGARRPPWFSGSFDEPYRAFVNHGEIRTEGNSIWAEYFENSGTNLSGIGPITLWASNAWLTGGAFIATNADITIYSDSLRVLGHSLQAARKLSLVVTNLLTDGARSGVGFGNQNFWQVGDGFDLLVKPAAGDLLGTTVTNRAFPYAHVINQWAGQDRGCSFEGYSNNAALGRLVLDGGANSLFTFRGVGPSNALYVDHLELVNYTTNRDANGDFIGLEVEPNMMVYFAQATMHGVSIAEKLNHRNGDRLRWVSSYAGFFSGTNVLYPDGTVQRLNTALVQSCNLDSDNDGVVNCADPTPVFVPGQYQFRVALTNTPAPRVRLSWQTIGTADNRLEYRTNLTAGPWVLLTNFVSNVNGPVTVLDAPAGIGRFYRLRVDTPQP